jgi:hypothetical protein
MRQLIPVEVLIRILVEVAGVLLVEVALNVEMGFSRLVKSVMYQDHYGVIVHVRSLSIPIQELIL